MFSKVSVPPYNNTPGSIKHIASTAQLVNTENTYSHLLNSFPLKVITHIEIDLSQDALAHYTVFPSRSTSHKHEIIAECFFKINWACSYSEFQTIMLLS